MHREFKIDIVREKNKKHWITQHLTYGVIKNVLVPKYFNKSGSSMMCVNLRWNILR